MSNLAIWGNHSATQYPDFFSARINGEPVTKVIPDEDWLKNTFIPTVQQRGAAIIKARGSSSAASAANAIVDTVRSIITPTPEGDWNSVAICSKGEYDVDAGLISSFPIRSDGTKLEVAKWLNIPDYSRWKIDQTVTELKEERDLVKELL